MSLTGTSTSISLRKQDLTSDRFSGTYRKVQFATKATGGETGINLTSLTTPSSEMPGFVQATAAEINAAQLLFNQKNLTLMSSVRGVLAPYMSYQVASNTQINFMDSFGTALPGEIFIGIIESTDKGASALQATSSLVTTGTLSAGSQDFTLNGTFTTNKNPTQQIGEVLVFLNGQLQYRNSGNASASATADGNYYEVDTGTGISSTIRFNVIDPNNDRAVTVITNGVMFEQPSGSMQATIQTLAGQQDLIVQTLAEVAGVPTSTFYAAPNNVDQLTYSNMVQSLNTNAALKNASNTWTANQQFLGKTDGVPVASGYIGQTIEINLTTGTAFTGSTTQYANILTITSANVPVGIWRMDGVAYVQSQTSPTTFSAPYLAFSDYSGNTTTDHVFPATQISGAIDASSATAASIFTIPGFLLTVTASSSKYVKVRCDFSGGSGSPQYRYSFRFTRIA